jgi:peptidoglycan/LPS O-acetylase OafA/YrhL
VSGTHYRPDIQGLRAIAVLAVMAFHFNPAWLPGGFIGVDVFLLISGFLITSILLNKKTKAGYTLPATLKYFYAGRFKRIAPAYFVMLVLVALVAAVFFLPKDFGTFKDGLEKAAWFNSNNYFADFGDYFAPANHEQPLLHTWSLAVEIQFYLLAPLLILLLPIKALKWTLVALLVGCTLLAEYRMRFLGIEQATYYSLYARLPEFFAGCLAALYTTSVSGRRGGRKQAWLSNSGLLLILLAAVAQPKLGHFPGLPILLPIMGTVLLLVSTSQGGVTRLLSSKTLVWIGALSYSLYLWHWPVLAFLRYYTGAELLDLSFSLLFITLTLLLSLASYYWVELPLRAKRTHKKQVLFWALLTAAILGTSQVMAKVNEAFTPKQLPIEYRRYADPDIICHGKIVGDCLRGNLSSNREVLVLGDSHGAMLNSFFDTLGRELSFKARVITASSCVTIPGFDYQRIAEWAQKTCLNQIEAAKQYLDDAKVVILAGMWSYQTQSEVFNNVLSDFLSNYPEKKIYILSQVPQFSKNIARVRRFDTLGLPAGIEREQEYSVANRRVSGIASHYPSVEFLSLARLPIFSQAPFLAGRGLMYSDEHHLSEVGAQAYAKSVETYFSQIFSE